MPADLLSRSDSPSVASDTGSHHTSDDDGFVLPSFAYSVPGDAYAPAPWEKRNLNDNTRADHTSSTANAARQPAKPATALKESVKEDSLVALTKSVKDNDHEHRQTARKVGAEVSAQRSAPSSSFTPSSPTSISSTLATQIKPQLKPKPTPQLDALTELMLQDLAGLSSSSQPATQRLTEHPTVSQGQAHPLAAASPALRVDAPLFVPLHSANSDFLGDQRQLSRKPQLSQQPHHRASSSLPPRSQSPRDIPPHMRDLSSLQKPAAESKSDTAVADSLLRDLQSLMPAPAPKSAHHSQSSLHSLSSLGLSLQPSAAADRDTQCSLDPLQPLTPTTPSERDLLEDLHLSSPPEAEHRSPSPVRQTPSWKESADDELIPNLFLPSSSPQSSQTQGSGSSEYPSTYSSYQNSEPGTPPAALPSSTSQSLLSSSDDSSRPTHMMDPDRVSYDYFLSRLRSGDDVFVRVEGPKNNRLQWTGETATSGYFGRQEAFKGLGPEAYEKAARDAGLDRPNWESQSYLWRSMDAHRWPDQGCVPADSPWISATNNLDWAIWRTANILASQSTVYMTFIRPTTERYSLPKPPLSKSRALRDQTKENSEVLFYGRIFAESIIARVKWTRAVSFASLGGKLSNYRRSHSRCPRAFGDRQGFVLGTGPRGSTTCAGT